MMGCLVRESATRAAPGTVEGIARACSPRVLPFGDAAAIVDASGLSRAIGPPEEIARQLNRLAADEGLVLRVALASTMTSAWVLAHARSGYDDGTARRRCRRARAAAADESGPRV